MPSWATIKLILAAVGVALACTTTGIITHKVDTATLLKMEAKYKDAEIAAAAAAKVEQAALDKVSSDADAAELAHQRQLLAAAQVRIGEVAKHVPTGRANCITWGLIRVIDATALGVDPDSLPLPAGKAEASCASRRASDLAANIVANYESDQRNIEHGQALQAYIESISKVKR